MTAVPERRRRTQQRARRSRAARKRSAGAADELVRGRAARLCAGDAEAAGLRANIEELVADRLRVNKLALKVPAWVALAVARLIEVPGHLGVPPSFPVCAAMFAFGDELLALPVYNCVWRTAGGRELAAAYLLPLPAAALLPRCSRAAAAGRCGW